MLNFAGDIVNSIQGNGHLNYVVIVIALNAFLVTEYHSFSVPYVMWKNRDNVSIYNVFYMVLDRAKALQALFKASNAPIVHLEVEAAAAVG